jgi:hypothetical protein
MNNNENLVHKLVIILIVVMIIVSAIYTEFIKQ